MRNFSACNLIRKETLVRVFSCKFGLIFKNNYFAEHLWKTASNGLIIATFLCKTYCSLKWKVKNIKDSCFLKLSVYLFNIFKGNDDITFVLICLDTNSKQTFFIKNVNFEKHIKPSAYSQTLSYIVGKCYELKENCMLMIRTDWSFCGQNLQSVAILYEKLKVFILNFSILILFSKLFSIVKFHSPIAF